MKKHTKICLGLLLTFVLAFSIPILNLTIISTVQVAEASTVPRTTVSKVTLYVSYKVYQIKFQNLSKNATITFSSSKTKIAEVSNAGSITPKAKGTAVITITMKQNGKKYISKINVQVENPSIKFISKTNELNVGDHFTFRAKSYGNYGAVTWKVSDDSIATINKKTGKLTAISEGDVDVTATAGSAVITYTVTITEGEASKYTATKITSIKYNFTITGVSKYTALKFYMLTADSWDTYYWDINVSTDGDYTLSFPNANISGLRNIGYFDTIKETKIKATLNTITINDTYVLNYNEVADLSMDDENGYANIWNELYEGGDIIAESSDAYLAMSDDRTSFMFYTE